MNTISAPSPERKRLLKRYIRLSLVVLFMYFFAGRSSGQECKQEASGWNPPSAGPITTWTAPITCKGSFVFQPFFFYNYIRGAFDSEGHFKHFKDGEKKSEFQESVFLKYGLFDRFDVCVFGTYQQVLVNKDGSSVTASGFNDTYLYLRYCLLDETDILPTATAIFQLKFPTGKYEKADPGMMGADIVTPDTGGGAYEEGYGLNFTKRIKPFILHADFMFGFPNPATVDGVNTRYGSYFLYDAAIEYFFYGPFNLMVEANGLTQGDKKESGSFMPSTCVRYLNLIAGLGWSDDKMQMLMAYQRTVAGTNTDVNDSFIATFVYTF